MSNEDEVVRIETVGKRRVYSEAEYDAQQAEIEYFKRRIDAAVLDADQWRQVATLTQYRLQGQLYTLRKHAEALVKALDNIGVTTDEDDILWTANHAIDNFRAAYPKEDSDDN